MDKKPKKGLENKLLFMIKQGSSFGVYCTQQYNTQLHRDSRHLRMRRIPGSNKGYR